MLLPMGCDPKAGWFWTTAWGCPHSVLAAGNERNQGVSYPSSPGPPRCPSNSCQHRKRQASPRRCQGSRLLAGLSRSVWARGPQGDRCRGPGQKASGGSQPGSAPPSRDGHGGALPVQDPTENPAGPTRTNQPTKEQRATHPSRQVGKAA